MSKKFTVSDVSFFRLHFELQAEEWYYISMTEYSLLSLSAKSFRNAAFTALIEALPWHSRWPGLPRLAKAA